MPAILALLLATAAPAAEPELPAAFHVDEVQRLRVDARVRLPRVMWMTTDRNLEARTAQFAVGMTLSCGAVEDGRKAWRVDCLIEDAALQAVPMPGDETRLQPVLEDMDRQLTGKVVRLRVRRDGRVTNVNLVGEGGPANRRTRLRDESLRLIAARGIAGLDLLRPRRFGQDTWLQTQSILTMAPTVTGTAGATDLAHQLTPADDGGYSVRSSGKALIVPATGGDGDTFMATLACSAVVSARGHLVKREWHVVAEPTASSAIADGMQGLPYVQEGTLRAVAPDEEVVLGETKEIEAWGPLPTALHGGVTYGAPRPPL